MVSKTMTYVITGVVIGGVIAGVFSLIVSRPWLAAIVGAGLGGYIGYEVSKK